MGSSYLKNHAGFQLTDAEFEDIPFPTAELTTHVTMKTIQAGALLGTCLIGPLAAIARAPTRNMAGMIQKSTRYGRNGMIIGAALGPLMTFMKVKSQDEAAIVDRDYRLRHNCGQVRVDRASIAGGIVGAGLTAAMGKPPLFGGLLGISAGILGMAAYNNSASKK